MTVQLTLLPSVSSASSAVAPPSYLEERDAAMRAIVEHAGRRFMQEALAFVPDYLAAHGEATGEEITDAAKDAGIVPHCDKAFGPVYARLARQGVIERAGFAVRKKGHGTAGGNIWRLKA